MGERVAIRFEDQALTYREFNRQADGFARLLAQRGVSPHQRVAVMASNRPELFTAVFGVLKLGASAVMISSAWKQAETAHAVDLTEPVLAITDGDTHLRLPARLSEHVIHLDDDPAAAAVADHPPQPAAVDLDWEPPQPAAVDLDWEPTEAVLVFSSGTTGMPKAVRHTHASLSAAVIIWGSVLGLTNDDRFQIATPPFHILGLLNLLSSVWAGSSVRLHPRFDLDAVLTAIENDRITLEMAVAPIAMAMANHPDLERYDLSSLRYIMWGATPVTESVAQRVTERTGVPFMPAYGTSEAPVLTSNPVHRPELWRLDSPGPPVHDVRIRIADLKTGEVQPPGEAGEIQAQSPAIMAGYLPGEANADAFAGGWYRTGDVGWMGPDGWLHITDRVKEMIKVKGFQVAPAEVEAALLGHPSVVDCAVFGVPDPDTGEAVAAAVQLADRADTSADELKALVADTLANYKRLRTVYFVEAIPRLPSGKTLRRELKLQFGH
ncbi:class I adenylate-forming enzyme family protein [Candidatus Poriferisocius sp.]|uniref:class I adenylate-forming enzyme family protein n=1 Tax=Candidatus Poriferisocius sp. TaxID=3101276 RepID=UPI003B018916